MPEYYSLFITQLLAFIAAVATAFIAYILANKQWEKKVNYEKQKIARGFLHELERLEIIIVPLINIKDESGFTVGHPNELLDAIGETGVSLSENKPLYDENGLFFCFRKEIYDFDNDIMNNILLFYHSILNANKYSTIYFTKNNSNESWIIQGEFFDHIREAKTYLPELKASLQKIVS